MKILIGGDTPSNLYVLETLMKERGFKVISAQNGEDALKKARFDPPDLILTDILMPVRDDGYALCRKWKSDDSLKCIPFIFYTSTYTDSKDETLALSLGADRFILKPQEPDVLIGILEEILEENRTAKQALEKPLGEEMEFFRQFNEDLFKKLEKKVQDLEAANRKFRVWEERYRLNFEHVTDVISIIGTDLIISDMSPSIRMLMGLKPEDFIGRPVSNLKKFLAPESFEKIMDNIHRILQGEVIPSATYPFVLQDGTTVYSEISGAPIISHGRITGLISVARNVTDRKKAEEALQKSEEKYRSLFRESNDAILLTIPNGPILDANPAACEMFGRSLEEIKQAGRSDLVDESDPRLKVALEQRERSGKVVNAEITMLHANGEKFPVEITLMVFTDMSGQYRTSIIIRDITERKRAEEALNRSFIQVRSGLRATVRAMAETVEARDPYTAGHQRRVSDLARSIATEMKLSKDQIDGIRTAAAIHDLGKLAIPAEILSKPTKLTEVEFSLIKDHPRAAYNILKNIQFPWPVARVVLEHHERMNGSGYPKGLTEDEILIESRILAVADVVESMASHRPYRAAWKIDVALKEIRKNRGTLYDPEAVDACLRLFNEKSYNLPE